MGITLSFSRGSKISTSIDRSRKTVPFSEQMVSGHGHISVHIFDLTRYVLDL